MCSPCYPTVTSVMAKPPSTLPAPADELDAKIVELGRENVAAFVAEIRGWRHSVPLAPGGRLSAAIPEVCVRHGVLLILDEVMSAWAAPVTCSPAQKTACARHHCHRKGMGAGYQPIGDMVASSSCLNTIVNGSGFFQHGHTYNGSCTACAAALAVLGR